MVEEIRVKDGYKRTDVGIIPEDWEVIELREYICIHSGESPSKFKMIDRGIPYFKVEQLNNSSKYQEITPYYIEKDNTIPKGSLIFPKRGASILLNKVRILNKDSYMDTNLMSLTIINHRLYNEYLYYVLINNELWRIADTTSIPQINNKHINPLKVQLPSLSEQKAVAIALADTDTLITSLENLIDKKKKIKQGTMQQLLTGEKRLPGFSGKMQVVRLDNIFELNKGEQLNRSSLSSKGEYPVINGGVEPSGYNDDWNMEGNTITISEGGNSCGYVNYLKTKFWSGGHAYTVKLRSSQIDQEYLYQLLKFNESNIMALRVGSGLPNIQKKRLYEYKLNLSIDLLEQKAIAQILSDMDAEIESLEQKLSKYKAIKQGMMQELLTGRIRLI